MALILPVPSATADNVGASVFKLMQLSKIVNSTIENIIVLDFCNTNFQFSCFLSGLFILSKGWEANGKKVSKINVHKDIANYLEMVKV